MTGEAEMTNAINAKDAEVHEKLRKETLGSAHKMLNEATGFILVTVLPNGATHSAYSHRGLRGDQTFALSHAMALENYRFLSILAGPSKVSNPPGEQ